jgi:hypothetical protein
MASRTSCLAAVRTSCTGRVRESQDAAGIVGAYYVEVIPPPLFEASVLKRGRYLLQCTARLLGKRNVGWIHREVGGSVDCEVRRARH